MAQEAREPKQPSEKVWYTINFDAKDALVAGDSLATLLSLICVLDPAGTVVTATAIEPASPAIVGNKVTFLGIGGTDWQVYKYTAKVRTVLGEELEEDLIVRIRES
jgi:hypothetical protein